MSANDSGDDGAWRRWLGELTRAAAADIDANLTLVRAGSLLAAIGSVAAAVRLSGAFHRFDRIESVPSWYFSRRKALRVRLVRQSASDPSVFFVYHTPLLRRVLLQDTLPPLVGHDRAPDSQLLAVRPFGVQVDESAHEWVHVNFVSSQRYMTVQLLHRLIIPDMDGDRAVATCTMALQRPPFRRDFAQELIANGYGECLPESMSKYDDGTEASVAPLAKRLQRLEASQMHAQMMQLGIWKDWQDEKLSSRVVSAGRRATARGLQKLVNKITG